MPFNVNFLFIFSMKQKIFKFLTCTLCFCIFCHTKFTVALKHPNPTLKKYMDCFFFGEYKQQKNYKKNVYR